MPFCYVFLLLGGPFHRLKAFLLLFFLCGGLVGVVFVFIGTLFGLPTPLPKFRRGFMPACPLTPMSNMQYSHSLTASCHFRDILKIVTKYFLFFFLLLHFNIDLLIILSAIVVIIYNTASIYKTLRNITGRNVKLLFIFRII